MKQEEIDAQVFELYDEYCHGFIDTRIQQSLFVLRGSTTR